MTLHELSQNNLMWKYFFELSAIPRPSRYEKLACRWVIDNANKWGLSYKQDGFGNISVQVPANHKELEFFPLVALQGHLDMVCEKDNIEHDFMKDPLKLRISDDNNWISATGTTLGADNGIAAAYQMAFMDPKCPSVHGPLEMIFTLDEETGLNGATALGDGMINAKYMINIDNSQEAMCCIGCAGGRDYLVEIPILREQVKSDDTSYKIIIEGLAGGHSGSEIYDGRASAIKLCERVLSEIRNSIDFSVSYIDSGDKRNAIPREARVHIHTHSSNLDAIKSLLTTQEEGIRKELIAIDQRFSLSISPVTLHSDLLVFTNGSLNMVLQKLQLCPHGVLMRRSLKSSGTMLSTNLAAVHTHDNHLLLINNSRFSNQLGLNHVSRILNAVFGDIGVKIYSENGYSAWEEIDNSPLEALFSKYYEQHNQVPSYSDTTHGGIECGIIKSKQLYHLDVISIGPEILFLHSPQERINIKSTENMWAVLCTMLANAKELEH